MTHPQAPACRLHKRSGEAIVPLTHDHTRRRRNVNLDMLLAQRRDNGWLKGKPWTMGHGIVYRGVILCMFE